MNDKAKDKQRPLKIVTYDDDIYIDDNLNCKSYVSTLNAMLIAESNLVAAGKDSAMPHLLAIVKELEKIHGFKFELLEEISSNGKIANSKSADEGSIPSVSATEKERDPYTTCIDLFSHGPENNQDVA